MTDFINIFLPPGKISKRIGLFFGSFNPVHMGHLAIAGYFAEFTGLDQIWFVVSPQNPFKKEDNLLDGYDRIELMRLAIGDDDRFRVSDVEFSLQKPSFTIDTLTRLREKYPDHHFTLIMGSDNLVALPQWKRYRDIIGNYEIFVYPRPGYDGSFAEPEAKITAVKAPLMEISSTFIREAIRAGKNMKFFVPAEAWKYIDKMNLYR